VIKEALEAINEGKNRLLNYSMVNPKKVILAFVVDSWRFMWNQFSQNRCWLWLALVMLELR
jgi:hypothetical protein